MRPKTNRLQRSNRALEGGDVYDVSVQVSYSEFEATFLL